MRNKDYYREEILSVIRGEITREDFLERYVTGGISDWLEQQHPEPDWSKVPIDTPVLASNDREVWHKRYFAGQKGLTKTTWLFGETSQTADNQRTSWRYMKLKGEQK